MNSLNEILPAAWSHANPIDILGDATPETYAKSLEIASKDENADGMLVILTPQSMTDPTKTAEHLTPYAELGDKPVIASWMGGKDVEEGAQILAQAGIPNFPFPDTAVRLFNYMWKYSYNLRGLYEVPDPAEDESGYEREKATDIIETAPARTAALSSPKPNPRPFSPPTTFPLFRWSSPPRPTKPLTPPRT